MDRPGGLQSNQTLDLLTIESALQGRDIDRNISNLCYECFPNGISRFGAYIGLFGQGVAVDSILELTFELVRQLQFPQMLSRWQSLFGFKELEDAHHFKLEYNAADASVWKVKTSFSTRHDMRLLSLDNDMATVLGRAHRYWRGEAGSQDPIWEHLLQYPVEILERIE